MRTCDLFDLTRLPECRHFSSIGNSHRSPLTNILTACAIGGFFVSAQALGAADSSSPGQSGECPWVDSGASDAERAAQVLAEMTLDEKLSLVHGGLEADLTGLTGYSGVISAIPRLCIPRLTMSDGPAGVRISNTTQLPAPVSLAATWNSEMAYAYGKVIGSEAVTKGVDVQLGPEIDIVRDPRAGRAFETYSEDPVLAGVIGAATVRGIQDQGVQSQVKHWSVYNQETFRGTPLDDVQVDDRTVRELYAAPFERVVKEAQPSSLMCAYSYINGQAACENSYLNSILKGDWAFPGYVTSDWVLATHSTVASANNGMDMEMPYGVFYGLPLKAAVLAGTVSEQTLDDMVQRILQQEFRFGLFNNKQKGSYQAFASTDEHVMVAADVAAEGAVLLKNEGRLLPLTSAVGKIAVIGLDAADASESRGFGSAMVAGTGTVTPLQGIQDRAGSVAVTYTDGEDVNKATQVAQDADVAIVYVARGSAEGLDQSSLDLSSSQNDLIAAVAQHNPNTLVVLNTGSAVTMPWLEQVHGVLEMWYPGQQSGTALASLLFGDANPSGKLPITFPKRLEDLPAAAKDRFPGAGGKVNYSEGLDIGYRWYDETGIAPLFPFGFGLSCTRFEIGELSLDRSELGTDGSIQVGTTVTNTGDRAGSEVVQLYLAYPATSGEPVKVLQAFTKVSLEPGESKKIALQIDAAQIACWSSEQKRWELVPGRYAVKVGNSSDNLVARAFFSVPEGGPVDR